MGKASFVGFSQFSGNGIVINRGSISNHVITQYYVLILLPGNAYFARKNQPITCTVYKST